MRTAVVFLLSVTAGFGAGWTQLFNDTTTLSVTLPSGALAASSTYYWYYTVTVFHTTTRVPYGSDYFRFYTNTLP